MDKVPVLFMIFLRPEIALKSFLKIKEYRPSKLYIASDGPRNEKEEIIVELNRKQIIDQIDWACDIQTLFRKHNLGCKYAVESAITWFFANVEYGVILEDDCVADMSFFTFSEDLLLRYKDDYRVGMISGFNALGKIPSMDSYCFSKYMATWGWATWRRAWSHMDLEMDWRSSAYNTSIINNMGYKGKDLFVWNYRIKHLLNKTVDTWDWQWYLSLSANNQMCIFPSCNLISNIGNDKNATHTSFSRIYLKRKNMHYPLKHPMYILPSLEFDKKYYIDTTSLYKRILMIIPYKIRKKVKIILKNISKK